MILPGPFRLLFVCGGNTCRSPMAAAVTRRMALARELAMVVDSAGIAARAGSPASMGALQAAHSRGYRLDGHRARRVRAARLTMVDLVVVMTREHASALHALTPPGARVCCRLLASFAPQLAVDDIADPWQGDSEVYARTFELVETACAGLVEALLGDRTLGSDIMARAD